MGDLGLPGSGRADDRRGAQKALWEVRKAGLNIMMIDEGRRQAGVVHRGLRGAARAPRRIHRPADARSSAKHGTRGTWYAHASRRVRCTCGRSSTCGATARRKMRAIAEEACAMVREYKGAYSGEHGDGLVPQRVGRLAVRTAARRARSRRSRRCSIRPICMNPGKIVAPPQMDDASLFRYPPGYRALPHRDRARLVGVERRARSARPAR